PESSHRSPHPSTPDTRAVATPPHGPPNPDALHAGNHKHGGGACETPRRYLGPAPTPPANRCSKTDRPTRRRPGPPPPTSGGAGRFRPSPSPRTAPGPCPATPPSPTTTAPPSARSETPGPALDWAIADRPPGSPPCRLSSPSCHRQA